jgi:secreted protein with Ig-like and vWFA domain
MRVFLQAKSAYPVLEVVKKVLNKHQVPRDKAIVFGSAGGMSSFLLTEHFNSVSLRVHLRNCPKRLTVG